MIGLEYIRTMYRRSRTELSERIGVSRQNINQWETGARKITPKYIPLLVKEFGIPEEYYQKQLSEMDKLDIEQEKLKNEIDESEFLYDDEIYDSDTGECITVQSLHTDRDAVEYLSSLIVDKKELVLLEKIKHVARTTRGGFGRDEDNEYQSIYDYNHDREDSIKLFDRFADIVNCSNIDTVFLHEILRAIELTDTALANKHQVRDAGKKLVEDSRPMTQDILAVLTQYLAIEQQRLEQPIKDTQELMKLFDYTAEMEDQ